MTTDLIAPITTVDDSPWLGKDVTDHLGRPATVRRVYDVRGQHVTVLTSTLPASNGGEATCGEHVDLLSADGQPPAFPDFQDRFAELVRLEEALYSADATSEDAARFRAADQALKPYREARRHLRQALIQQAQPGDRVYLTGKDWYATIIDADLDADADADSDLPRLSMRVRLDDAALHDDPYLLKSHPDGIIEYSTLKMWPTLNLI
ncbi:hypothetical protein ABR737_00385 [Streptomyces sp. Edi2]|uniref:hypothetical protein n=1 Tax=Streptomyces sp. Edi2 TaxID=3162528 RepID=UPI0033068033